MLVAKLDHESIGRLFKNDLRLYVYPFLDRAAGKTVAATDHSVAPHLQHLYAYLLENSHIQPIEAYDAACLPIFSRDVIARIRSGDATWETMVPMQVARLIKERRLFGYNGG